MSISIINVSTEDTKDIYFNAHLSLSNIMYCDEDDNLLEYVKSQDEDAYKRLVVLINIFKQFPNDIKVQSKAFVGKRMALHFKVVCLILKYTFKSAEHVSQLMEELYDERESMDNGNYVMACNSLKIVNKFKDAIFSDGEFKIVI